MTKASDRARRHRLRGPRADARGQARDPRRRFLASDLSNARGAKSQFKLSGRIGEHGRVPSRDDRDPDAVAIRHAGASGLSLVALKPYFEHEVNVVVTGGVFAAKGQVGWTFPTALRCVARGKVDDEDHQLRIVRQADVVRSRALEVAGGRGHGHSERTVPRRHRLASPSRLLRARHRVSGRHDQYREAGNTGGEPEPTPRCEAGTPAERGASSAPLPVSMGRIELARGNVVFTDLFVRPNYSANLTDVAGSVSAMSATRPVASRSPRASTASRPSRCRDASIRSPASSRSISPARRATSSYRR
jgi:hypothetical protein